MLQLIEISLICTGIHVCFLDGMVFYRFRLCDIVMNAYQNIYPSCTVKQYKLVDSIMTWISKPLYDCLPCMASFWTIVLMQKFDLKSILIVCGMNAIISSVLQFFANSKLPE